MKRNLIFLSTFILTVLLLSSCSVFNTQSTPESTPVPTVEASNSVISQGSLVPKDFMYLPFPAGGHIEEILVKQGDQVTTEQVLARLGDRQQYEASLTATQLEVESAQQALNDLNKNADISSANAWLALEDANQAVINAENVWNLVDTDEYQKKIDDAEIKVSEAKTALDDAQKEFDKYANLAVDNPTYKKAETALNKAQDEYDTAVHERDQLIIDKNKAEASLQLTQALQVKAQTNYDSTRQGPDPDQLMLAQMNLDTALAHQTSAQAALDNLDLKAPFSGTVVDVNVSTGELVSPEKWAVLVADFSDWYVETSDLTELEVTKISMDQVATIKPDALPELQVKAKVTEIADRFYVQAGDVLYKVRLHVEQPDPAFRWGMTVEVTFNP